MRVFTTLSMTAACLVMTGCSSIHLHNEKAAATAKAAAEDFEASKFGERLKSRRVILLSLEERDVVASRKLTLVERDQHLLGLAANKKPLTTQDGFAHRMLTYLEARLKALDGDPLTRAKDQAAMVGDLQKLSNARQRQANARLFLAFRDPRFGSIPRCDAKVAALKDHATADSLAALVSKDFTERAKSLFNNVESYAIMLGTECQNELDLAAKVRNATTDPDGLLRKAITAYEEQKNEIENAEDNAKKAKGELTGAAKSVADATKDLTAAQAMTDFTCPAPKNAESAAPVPGPVAEVPKPPPAGAAEQKDAAASQSKLCKALDDLHKLGGVGEKIIAEEKIAKIRFVLEALSGVTPTPAKDEEVDSSLALIAATTRLGHALRLYRQADQWPPLEPLIIERQLAEVQLAATTARVALNKKRLAYHAEIVDSIRKEIDLLGEARTELLSGGFGGRDVILRAAPCTRNNVKLCSSYEALLRDPKYVNGEPAERPAYRAMARLSDSYSMARDRQKTADVRLTLSGYQESLILSEQALASWNAVLVTPIDLLREYHAGGIKASDIAPILQTIGIFTVAGRID